MAGLVCRSLAGSSLSHTSGARISIAHPAASSGLNRNQDRRQGQMGQVGRYCRSHFDSPRKLGPRTRAGSMCIYNHLVVMYSITGSPLTTRVWSMNAGDCFVACSMRVPKQCDLLLSVRISNRRKGEVQFGFCNA